MRRRRASSDDGWPEPFGVGSASPASGGDEDKPERVTMLYVPNPEYASGWELYPVWREKPKPEKRSVGYRSR